MNFDAKPTDNLTDIPAFLDRRGRKATPTRDDDAPSAWVMPALPPKRGGGTSRDKEQMALEIAAAIKAGLPGKRKANPLDTFGKLRGRFPAVALSLLRAGLRRAVKRGSVVKTGCRYAHRSNVA